MDSATAVEDYDTAAHVETIPATQPRPKEAAFYRPELDILRFFAFLGVLLHHSMSFISTEGLVKHHVPFAIVVGIRSLIQGGTYGVDLFFCLSAYLITVLLLTERTQKGHIDIPRFYLRRILRIWPVYFLVVFVAALLSYCSSQSSFGPEYVVPFLLFVGNWSMLFYGWPVTSIAVPLWSVSVEEQFYLLWPPLIARLSRQRIILASILLIVVATVTRFWAYGQHQNCDHLWGNTFAHLDAIGAGILVATLLGRGATRLRLPSRLALIAFGLFAIVLRGWDMAFRSHNDLSLLEVSVEYPLVTLGCVATLVAFIGLPIRSAVLQYLGKISYGLYAYHYGCLIGIQQLLRSHGVDDKGAEDFVLTLCLTIPVAAASYVLVEKPFLRLKRLVTLVPSRTD
jgi:peptidoglycan/LPS O-acetylase OafA/YrhL